MKNFAFRTRLSLSFPLTSARLFLEKNFYFCYAVVNLRKPFQKKGVVIKEDTSLSDSLYIIALRKNFVKCFFDFIKDFFYFFVFYSRVRFFLPLTAFQF